MKRDKAYRWEEATAGVHGIVRFILVFVGRYLAPGATTHLSIEQVVFVRVL